MTSLGEAPPESTAPRWDVLGESVRGADHVLKGTVCQDSYAGWTDGRIAVVAVADGHGSAAHARSDVGARLAVELAVRELRALGETLSAQSEAREIEWQAKDKLARRLVWEWRTRVMEHAAESPPTGPRDEHETVKLYGTTLLAALLTDRFCVTFQLGDGAIASVDAAGVAKQVFPDDDELYGGATYSMCGHDAWRNASAECRAIDGGSPALVLVCTDGLQGAFQDDAKLLAVGPHFLRRLREEGRQLVAEALPGELTTLSERSIGDDVTVALVWRAEAAPVSAELPPEACEASSVAESPGADSEALPESPPSEEKPDACPESE